MVSYNNIFHYLFIYLFIYIKNYLLFSILNILKI